MPDLSTTLSTSSPQTPHIFMLIIHYGDPAPTIRLYTQLANQAHKKSSIIIVNHGPKPLSQAKVPQAQIITQKNRGYAAGIARGLEELKHKDVKGDDIVVVLNNDGIIFKNFTSTLRHWWSNQPNNVLAGASIGSVNLLSGRAHSKQPPRFPWEISYVHGAILSAHYALLTNIPLPTRLFLYWEDASISIRACATGSTLKRLPRKIFQHDDQPYTHRPEKTYYLVRNGAAFLEHESPHLWRYWWKIINTCRTWYHQIAGNDQVARALQDRVDIYG